MNESIPHHFFNPSCLYWLPKITNDLYDNIDKIIRDTIDRDPLLFIFRPIWKLFNNHFMIIKVSDIQNISIFLVYKYAKISHVYITEDWWQNESSCNVKIATIDPTDCMIKWTLNDNQIIDRVTNALIKLGLVKWTK